MKNQPSKVLIGTVLAVSLTAVGMNGSAQAHGDVDLSIPAQLLLLNAFLDPYRDHDHHYTYVKPRRIVSHHRHGHQHHKRYKHHKRHDHYKPRRHSHSRDGYRDHHRGKKRHRD